MLDPRRSVGAMPCRIATASSLRGMRKMWSPNRETAEEAKYWGTVADKIRCCRRCQRRQERRDPESDRPTQSQLIQFEILSVRSAYPFAPRRCASELRTL